MRCWSKNKHEKDGQPPRAWGKNHHRPAADQKESCRASWRGVEGGVRRLYPGDDGAVYDAVDCQQRRKSERESIIAALHGQSIFNGGGLSPLNKISPSHPPKPATVAVPEETEKKARDVNEKTALLKKKSATELGELATSINTIARDAHMEANLEMEIVPQGLRVLIKDDQNRNMFERGSAQIMPFFKTLLVELAPVFDSLDNKIIITGHTDAMAYKNNIYNNWNLSGDRALSARRVLEEAGMPEDKVMQVSAMADQMLLDSKNPQSAGNRRIEIMVLTKSASDTLYQYFGQHGDKVVQPLVQKLDKQQVLSQRTR